MCPGDLCGPYCDSSAPECYIMTVNEAGDTVPLDPTDGTLGGRGDLNPPGGSTDGLTIADIDCPDECCI